MKADKAWLPVGDEFLLQRIVRLVSLAVPRMVVAARHNQRLPQLAGHVTIVRDVLPDAGPLAGMSAAFAELADTTDAAFVCACDHPLLHPALIKTLFARFDLIQQQMPVTESAWPKAPGDGTCEDRNTPSKNESDTPATPPAIRALIPRYNDRAQSLLGVYALSNAPLLQTLLESGERSVRSFVARCGAHYIDADELRDCDPQLDSFLNANTPDELSDILQRIDSSNNST